MAPVLLNKDRIIIIIVDDSMSEIYTGIVSGSWSRRPRPAQVEIGLR